MASPWWASSVFAPHVYTRAFVHVVAGARGPAGVGIFLSGRFFEIFVAQVGVFPCVLIFAASGRIRELRVRGGA